MAKLYKLLWLGDGSYFYWQSESAEQRLCIDTMRNWMNFIMSTSYTLDEVEFIEVSEDEKPLRGIDLIVDAWEIQHKYD